MSRYQYRAKNIDGRSISGFYDADTKEEVITMLKQKSYFPMTIEEVQEEKKSLEIEFSKKINVKSLYVFCEQMATILDAGVSLSQGLDIMIQQSEDKKLKAVLLSVYENVHKGYSLSAAFSEHTERFPTIFISMIEAGEASGMLGLAFKRLSNTFEKEFKLKKKVKAALTYPMIVVVVAVIVVIFLLVAIVPLFVDMFDEMGQTLPLPTRILISMSDFVVARWYVLLGIAISIAISFNIYKKSDNGRYTLDKLKMTMPVIGPLMSKVVAANFTRTLSTLSAVGISIINALDLSASSADNVYLEKKIRKAAEDIRKGFGLGITFEEMHIFPPLVIHMTKLGEEAGTLDDMLNKTSLFYDEESDAAISAMVAMLEPAVIIVLAGIVLFVILSILLPMLQSYSMVA